MAHVAFVEPHPIGQRPFLRGLKRAGCRITGIGSLPIAQLDAELRHILDVYEVIADPTDPAELSDAVRRLQQRGPRIERLEAMTGRLQVAAARAREAANIPGVSSEIAALTSDAPRLQAHLAAHGVPTAPTASATDRAALAALLGGGSSVVLKPLHATSIHQVRRIDDPETLFAAIAGLSTPEDYVVERFAAGHEGYADALLVNGEIVHEAVAHFYPTVLEAMTDRAVSPVVVHTNRLLQDGYDRLREIHRSALRSIGVTTSATHLEWLHGPEGVWVSAMGVHPPPYDLWELYGEAGEFDLYTEWARAVALGDGRPRPASRRAAGLVNLRPSQDGVIRQYEGVEWMQRQYGALVFRMHLPPAGTPTQPVDAGYHANAYVCMEHDDYDELRRILAEVGQRVKVYAEP